MDSTQFNHPRHAENVLLALWAKYFPYWPFFLLLLVLSVTATWFYLQKTAPLYEATATLLIKDEKKGIDDSRMIESLNLLSTKKIVENEIEVLASRSLMEEVATNLKLYAPVFQKSKWRDKSAYSSSPIKIEVMDPATISIEDNPRVFFSFDADSQVVIIDKTGFPLNQWIKTPYGVLKFTHASRQAPGKTVQLYFSLTNLKKVVMGLTPRLDAIPSSKLSTVIDLKLKDEDPLLAEDILNQLILAYNRAAVNDKNALAQNTLSFVQERLDYVGHHLDSIEHKIQQYKANKGAVDIGSQGKLFLENVSVNDRKVGDVNMQLAVLGQIEKYVLSKDNNGGIVPSTLGASDPLLTSLINKLYEAELEKEKLRKTTGENSPLMVGLTDQIEKIKPSILENIHTQRKSLEASKTDLISTNNAYTSLLQSIPQKERDLVEISRQQNIENSIYSFLLQKREEAALSNSSTVADNRIIDKAQSSLGPVSPNKRFFYLVAMMGALGLGVAAIAAKELFSRNILYRSEIENFTAVPIIAEIGFDKSKEALVIRDGVTSVTAEQFRRLRASLGFVGIGNTKKKILVTSTIPGDGKSFIAANLGLSLALAGKKVVLVEADLHYPSLSKKLGAKEEKGLSDYLSGDYPPAGIVRKTSINNNLFLIPAGALPNNPSELLMNGKMETLLQYLDSNYDFVLVDTAPVGAISDAYTLSPLCDATLYIIRHEHTPKTAVERLDRNNQVNGLKNTALIFNGVRTRGFGKDSFGNNYKYTHKREKTS
ncbi:MAG: polysaccharide biosynthesis tyrosine autokinase [Chitinophagaceae bacterium]